MKKIKTLIDLNLQDPNCTMFVPGYKYPRDENDMPIPGNRNRIGWNPENLKKLEHLISTTMIQRYQQELSETMENKLPILYVDCSKK